MQFITIDTALKGLKTDLFQYRVTFQHNFIMANGDLAAGFKFYWAHSN